MVELKPCPVCGSLNVDVVETPVYRRRFARCACCGMRSRETATEAEAAAAWNRRPLGDCTGCCWKNTQKRKCSSCRRNENLKDNFEEAKHET